jgi:hypothetical protein
MNLKKTTIAICFAMLLITRMPTPANAQESCDTDTSQECVAAAKVGTDVQTALRDANATGLSGLSLKKAVLTLETGGTVTNGFNINFLIFTIKHQTKKGNTVTQVITWGTLPKPAGGGKAAQLQQILAQAIATSAKIASSVTTLPLSEATITIKFVVDKDNGGSVSYKVLGVNLGPSIDLDKTSTNTLAVTFSK